MKKVALFVVLIATFCSWSFAQPTHGRFSEQIIVERIYWFYELKNHVGNAAWPNFNSSKATLVYYTDSSSFFVHPTKEIITRYQLNEISRRNRIKIYKSNARIDDIAFHMSTGYSDTDSAKVYFKNPTMLCSDIESARKVIGDLNSLQTWATILLHEYFHGFQFTYPQILRYANEKIHVPDRKLQHFYDQVPSFKKRIENENAILLRALSSNNAREFEKLLEIFVSERESRRKHFGDSLGIDFEIIENYYEKIEGSARYVELELYKSFPSIQANKWLLQNDSLYDKSAYSNLKIEDLTWMYQTESSAKYFYATGFNLLRVLDKLGVSYKKKFFYKSNSPYSILKNHIGNGT